MIKFFPILCFALALPTLGKAQTSVIPYSGQLEAGGVQVSDDVQMRFRLFSANPDGADPAPAPVWSSAADDAWNTVKVFQGKFHVNLGGEGFRQGAEGIPDSVFDAEQIWMRIEIDNGNNADHVLPSQALHTVPRAVSAKRATNFTVTQMLTVRNVRVDGRLDISMSNPGEDSDDETSLGMPFETTGGETIKSNLVHGYTRFSDPVVILPGNARGLTVAMDGYEGAQGDGDTHFAYAQEGELKNFIRGGLTIVSSDLKLERGLQLGASLTLEQSNWQTVSNHLTPLPFSQSCSAGKRLVSGGCNSQSDKAILYYTKPEPAENRWTCGYRKRSNGDPNIRVMVYALCL